MEAARVAQASHLNDALPMAVVRGISDPADPTKAAPPTEQAGSDGRQPARLRSRLPWPLNWRPLRPDPQQSGQRSPSSRMPPAHVTNTASGNARVGAQAGQIFGSVWNSFEDPPQGGDVLALLASLSRPPRPCLPRGPRSRRRWPRGGLRIELDAATEAATGRQAGRHA